jgi:iron complex transport system substrate-binding protein
VSAVLPGDLCVRPLHVDPDRGGRRGNHHEVTGVRDAEPESGSHRSPVLLAALCADGRDRDRCTRTLLREFAQQEPAEQKALVPGATETFGLRRRQRVECTKTLGGAHREPGDAHRGLRDHALRVRDVDYSAICGLQTGKDSLTYMTTPHFGRIALPTAALLALGVLLSGCAASEGAADATSTDAVRTVDTVLGDVSVPEDVDSVVVLEGRRDLDIVLSLGLPLVGYPYEEEGSLDLTSPVADALEQAKSDGAEELFLADEINLEAIAEAAPALIVSRVDDVEPIRDELEAIAPVLAIGEQSTSTWQDDLLLVAEATGTTETAEQLIADYDARVDEISTTYADVLASVTLAPVGIDDEGSQVRPSRLLSSVMRDVGVQPSAAFAESIEINDGVEYGPEQLLSAFGDADGIIALVNEPSIWESFQTDPLFSQLPAVAEGHVVRSDKQTHEGAALTAMHSLDTLEELLQSF